MLLHGLQWSRPSTVSKIVYTADCDAEGATWLQFFFECKFVSRVSEFFLRQRANCTPSRAAPPGALRPYSTRAQRAGARRLFGSMIKCQNKGKGTLHHSFTAASHCLGPSATPRASPAVPPPPDPAPSCPPPPPRPWRLPWRPPRPWCRSWPWAWPWPWPRPSPPPLRPG